MPAGSYKVQVSAEKLVTVVSTNKNAPKEEEMRNYLPNRYTGSGTELTASVGKSSDPVNFDLKSDAPKSK